jgi:hypothetical protein
MAYLFGSSAASISNIPQSSAYYYGGLFYAYDNSTINITNSNVHINMHENGIMNATKLHNGSVISMRDNSKATIENSNITSISCYEQPQIYFLQDSVCESLYTYGQPSYPYCNALIYKDGTSSILNSNLVDGAQIIDI